MRNVKADQLFGIGAGNEDRRGFNSNESFLVPLTEFVKKWRKGLCFRDGYYNWIAASWKPETGAGS